MIAAQMTFWEFVQRGTSAWWQEWQGLVVPLFMVCVLLLLMGRKGRS